MTSYKEITIGDYEEKCENGRNVVLGDLLMKVSLEGMEGDLKLREVVAKRDVNVSDREGDWTFGTWLDNDFLLDLNFTI